MPVLRLGARTINEVKASTKPVLYFDDDLKGFGLKVTPADARSWFVEYRVGEGGRTAPKKRIVIGSARTLTAEQARKAARELLARARLGSDPAGERSEARKSITVGELAEAFLAQHMEPKRKQSTAGDYRTILDQMVIPTVGTTKAARLTRAELAKLHLTHRERPYRANKMLSVVSSMYGFASKNGLVAEEYNPAKGIERFKEEGRERFLSAEEFGRLGAALNEAETMGIPWSEPNSSSKHRPKAARTLLGPHAVGAIRLLLLTGARLREILHLRWHEVDTERGLLRLPDSKTGKKTIVLSAAAQTILIGLPRAGEYVIAGNDPEKPRSDLQRPWDLVTKRAGLHGLRIHDLRHSYASVGAAGGLGLPIIGRLLGHTQPSTTHRYAHLDSDPLRRATDAIAEAIGVAMGGGRS
jgi:integrase